MGLFSFLSKNKQDPDDDFDVPVKPRRSRGAKASDAQDPVDPVLPEKKAGASPLDWCHGAGARCHHRLADDF